MCFINSEQLGPALNQGINDFAEKRRAERHIAEQQGAERAARQRGFDEIRERLEADGRRTAQLLQYQLQPFQGPELPDFFGPKIAAEINSIGQYGSKSPEGHRR